MLPMSGAFAFNMRNKVAKRLRKEAEAETVGESAKTTRKVYQQKKKEYKKP